MELLINHQFHANHAQGIKVEDVYSSTVCRCFMFYEIKVRCYAIHMYMQFYFFVAFVFNR